MFGTKQDQQKKCCLFCFFGTLQRLSGHVGEMKLYQVDVVCFHPETAGRLARQIFVQFVGGTASYRKGVQTNWIFLQMCCGEKSIE